MLVKERFGKVALWMMMAALLAVIGGLNQAEALTSTNIAVIDSPVVISGGSFPTNDPIYSGVFNFTNLPIASVNDSNLASYDTVLLNMASSGMNCLSNSLTGSQQQDLVNFVGNGGKLIIYDSECPPVDYSWLPYPFTTSNPGPTGNNGGALNIVEENPLSCSTVDCEITTGVISYIDTSLSSVTDAVGDMNVMITRDPNWCLDMDGTNTNQVTGPVHTYATYGSGLMIYNGLDMDDISNSGGGLWLTRIWELELRQRWNPIPIDPDTGLSELPCTTPVVCDPIGLKDEAIRLKGEALGFLDDNLIGSAIEKLWEAMDKETQALDQLHNPDCFVCEYECALRAADKLIESSIRSEGQAIFVLDTSRPIIRRAILYINRSIGMLEKADYFLNLCTDEIELTDSQSPCFVPLNR
jgi:hypothetical protein